MGIHKEISSPAISSRHLYRERLPFLLLDELGIRIAFEVYIVRLDRSVATGKRMRLLIARMSMLNAIASNPTPR